MKLLKRFMAILFIFLILAFPVEQKVQADTATVLATYETLAGITGVQPELAPLTALAATGLTCGLVYTNRDQLLAWGKYVKAQAILQGIDLSLVIVGNTIKMTSSFKTFLNNCVTSYQGTTLPTQTFNIAKAGSALPSNFYNGYFHYGAPSGGDASFVMPTSPPVGGSSSNYIVVFSYWVGGVLWINVPSGTKVYMDSNNVIHTSSSTILYSQWRIDTNGGTLNNTWAYLSSATSMAGSTLWNYGTSILSSTVPIYGSDQTSLLYSSSDTVTVPTTTASKSSVSKFTDNDVITINPNSSLLNTGIGATNPMSSVLKDSAGVIPATGNPSTSSTTTTTTVDINPILNDAVNSIAGKIGGTVTKSDNLWKIITKSSTITMTEEDNPTAEEEKEIEEKAKEAAKKRVIDDKWFEIHILGLHGSDSQAINKSKFNKDFDIKKGIDDALNGADSKITEATKDSDDDREKYEFEKTYKEPIGKKMGQTVIK